MATSHDPPITLSVQRLLGDRSYEKRKTGAINVEESVRGLKDRCSAADLPAAEKAKLDTQIRETITQLGEMFCRSPNANHRKGGLIGLAGAAIGLMEKTHEYLNVLLPPVLHCFQDPESRVRYYACESLFNIAKVSRNFVLAWFPKIFSGLCQLYSDVDVDVKNGAQLLDRLIKEIVTESTDFEVDVFIPLLQVSCITVDDDDELFCANPAHEWPSLAPPCHVVILTPPRDPLPPGAAQAQAEESVHSTAPARLDLGLR